jgi:methylenetetrahydrofolate dehydrogenase (NADP+)/methenyltetrahydrofolate cyclohydrolase
MELIKSAGVDVSGKEAVVVGRSNIVGKPVSMLLLRENATVTICHSRTKNLADVCRRADILVAAVGRPEMITADYVKEGAVVIDVGINRVGEKKVVGDVAFDEVKDKAAYITPVPGGVGPMTITMLLYNTLLSAQKRVSK